MDGTDALPEHKYGYVATVCKQYKIKCLFSGVKKIGNETAAGDYERIGRFESLEETSMRGG